MNGLSTIITTYKRNFSLNLLIKDLEKQVFNFPIEVIVINNNLKPIKISSKLKIKIINNFNKNRCSSRYKIAKSSKHQTIVFLDDDVHLKDRLFLSEFKSFFDKKTKKDIASSWCSVFKPNSLEYFSAQGVNFNTSNEESETDLIGPGISIFDKSILTKEIISVPKRFEIADNVWFSLQTSLVHKTKKYYFPSKNKVGFRKSHLSPFALYRSSVGKEQKEKSLEHFFNKGYLPIFAKNIKEIKTPIVLIAYNRPEILEKNLKFIKYLKLSKIYVVCDGPKNKDDKKKTDHVRSLIEKYLDKENLVKIYSSKNMGLRKRIVSGLNEVFKKEESAIILEDDCIADPSFFKLTEELLKKYKNNKNIGSISGSNYLLNNSLVKNSYYFSQYPHSWGWATWKRAWKLFDNEMSDWEKHWENHSYSSWLVKWYWHLIFSAVNKLKINSWAYRWTYSCWKNSLLTIIPQKNLVTNIGVGKNASNTRFKSSILNMNSISIKFPLIHPKKIVVNKKLDKITEKNLYIKPRTIIGALIKLIK
jgi:hypothetical protein